MMLDYSYKPSKKNVLVGFYNDSDLEYYKDLVKNAIFTAERYGIQLLDNLSDFEPYEGCLIKHAIVIAKTSNPLEASKQYQHLLNWYNSMSISLSYSSHEEMLSWRSTIEDLKKKYNDKVNYLRPDLCIADNIWVGSQQKILDNIVCDTVRVKYNPVRDLTFQVNPGNDIKKFFLEMSRIYSNYKLYHRSTTDGFLSIKHGSGFYITATKTNKAALDLTRIAYVHHYDEASNKLFYSGNYLPSSDVVEAAIVYRENPHITALVHTHASDLYTRNPSFKSKIKIGRGSYGVPELGKAINQIINEYYNDFIILEEHGEVFALLGGIDECIKTMEGIVKNTAKISLEECEVV